MTEPYREAWVVGVMIDCLQVVLVMEEERVGVGLNAKEALVVEEHRQEFGWQQGEESEVLMEGWVTMVESCGAEGEHLACELLQEAMPASARSVVGLMVGRFRGTDRE